MKPFKSMIEISGLPVMNNMECGCTEVESLVN